jgi:(p)ppGpp synthase/HD superfamily hydrolase
MNLTLSDALKLMRQLHEGQTDSSGRPYEYHPQRVAGNLQMLFPDATQDELMAALLHDVIEDCEISPEHLRNLGYSENCVEMVVIVSKPKDDERSYEQVIGDIINLGNRGAMRIKIADNADNSHPQRVSELAATDHQRSSRLIKRYKSSIAKLCEAIGYQSDTVFELIRRSPDLSTYQYPEKGLFTRNHPVMPHCRDDRQH